MMPQTWAKGALKASLAALLLAPAPLLADGLIDNVSGLTLDEKGEWKRFTGLVIDDDGKVKTLLDRKDKRPADLDFRLDAKGQTMLPGMIDAHVHVMEIGFAALTLDLSATTSLAEAQAKLAAYAAENPDFPWIIGTGWNQEKWGLGRFPTAAEIDSVISDRPVWLSRADGHAGWANSKAMQAAGISAQSRSAPGGRIEMAGGKPSGVFVDKAMDLLTAKIPAPRAADRDVALAKAQQILIARGVTAVADMGTSLDDWQAFRRAGDRGALQIRIMAYAAGIDQMVTIAGPGPTPWLYEDRLRLNGVKLYYDGALGSRGAWLKAPYSDDPGNRGLPMLTGTQLRNLMSRAAMDEFQVAVHAIGDAANADLIDAIEEMALTYQGDRRWRIEHAQVIDPADLARVARFGTFASMQPVHQTSDRLMAEARLGPNRLAGAYAWASLAKLGVPLAFGSDAPVEVSNPFESIAVAMTREDMSGQPFGGWQPQERINRQAAFAAHTSDAAKSGFAESRIGKLLPGMRADFLLIDGDFEFASPSEIRKWRPNEVWIGGKRAF